MQNLLAKLSGLMSKTYIGFATVLIGGVLVFVPMNHAMATPSATTCTWVTDDNNCRTASTLTSPVTYTCNIESNLQTNCFRSNRIANTYYSFSDCSSCISGYKLETHTMSSPECGTITYQTCVLDDSGSGDDDGGDDDIGGPASFCRIHDTDRAALCDESATPVNDFYLINCNSIKVECYGGYTVGTCEKCTGQLALSEQTFKRADCTNSYTFDACGRCTSDDDCVPSFSPNGSLGGTLVGGTSDGLDILDIVVSQRSKITYTCGTLGECGSTKDCWCGAGFYGAAGCDTECTRCPVDSKSGKNGACPSAQGQSTTIDDCYIPVDTAFSTSVGSGTYSTNCAY